MRFASWLSLGIGAAGLVVACGGNVSLGTIGGELAADGGGASSSGGSSSGSTGGGVECKDPALCGPALGMPNYDCGDGTTGGPTGRCLVNPDGSCGWEVRECPAKDGGPAPTACFDSGGKVLDAHRACTTAADCVVVKMGTDCCGNSAAVGVAKSSEKQVAQCAGERDSKWPACGCPAGPTKADDGTTDPSFGSGTADVTCHNNKCETTFKPEKCGNNICTATQTCCGPMPLPEATCVDGANSPCPISQRKMKKDILYLSDSEKEQLSSELMSFPLATYRYKTEGNEQKPHLGFIIDDVAPSPAVLESGERVDLYGYSTMTVAALQVQAKEIAELKKQMEELKKDCSSKKAAPKK